MFLESACFTPAAVAGTGRGHKLHTDAAYRYERGVDPALQRLALERASRLIIEVAGGRAGIVCMSETAGGWPSLRQRTDCIGRTRVIRNSIVPRS